MKGMEFSRLGPEAHMRIGFSPGITLANFLERRQKRIVFLIHREAKKLLVARTFAFDYTVFYVFPAI